LPDLGTVDGTPMKYTHNNVFLHKISNWRC
jgi:hypothetical protein